MEIHPIPLYNQPIAKHTRKKEDAVDRLILFLTAQGFTNKEICEELDLSPWKVTNTKHQTWFLESLVQLMHQHGEPAIEHRLKTLAMEMMERGAELARNAESEQVKCTSIFNFLKLYRGDKVTIEDKRVDLAEIRAKREGLQQQLREMKGELTKSGEDGSSGTNRLN